jgi:hypothetical protein
MTVVVRDVRKVVVIEWDLDLVVGKTASVQADGKELRVVPNRGYTNVFYPLDWTGSTDFTIRGSSRGEDTGTIEVSGEEESSGPDEPIIPPETETPPDGGGNVGISKHDFIVVSDMGGTPPGSQAKEFVGIALQDSAEVGDTISVQVNCDDAENGFGWDTGVSIQFLKDLGEGKVGA